MGRAFFGQYHGFWRLTCSLMLISIYARGANNTVLRVCIDHVHVIWSSQESVSIHARMCLHKDQQRKTPKMGAANADILGL